MHRESGIAVARIPAFDFGDRPGDEFLEEIDVEVRQALEVQTGLADFVSAEPGQEVDLRGVVRVDIDDQFSAADCEAHETCVA